VLLAVLSGCADVAASPESSPSKPRTASTPASPATTPAPAATPSGPPSGTPSSTTKPVAPPTPVPPTSVPPTPKQQPTPKPTPKPTAKPTQPPSPRELALQVEQKLASFGYPVGGVDGVITKRARQALCVWRETAGLPISRGRLTTEDVRSVLTATERPVPARADGIYVNKTCQVLLQVVDNAYRRIVWVSTGAAGYDTPQGVGKVWRKWAGAHESSLYDDAYMYDSIYFLRNRPGIALHGSRANSLIKTYPASHSCVRVMRPAIHQIFAETPIGTKVMVYGEY
jgi:lipoprotein-anchoring transpeptidase ErfK/SrfK